jgi:hypothetical protein
MANTRPLVCAAILAVLLPVDRIRGAPSDDSGPASAGAHCDLGLAVARRVALGTGQASGEQTGQTIEYRRHGTDSRRRILDGQ